MAQKRKAGPAESCASKHGFATERMANDVARRMRRRKDKASHCSAYRCQHCGMFHLGQSVAPMKFNAGPQRKSGRA